jgi:hypothetical protein
MAGYFDRYEEFRDGNKVKLIPGLKLPLEGTDKKVVYKQGVSRLDKISMEYYGAPFYGWLIMMYNRSLGAMEFDIPNNEIITVPFPLNSALSRYVTAVKEHENLNG